MKNFGLIYKYELKKIIKRKLFIILSAIIVLATIIINLDTIFEYSVGSSGADLTIEDKYGRTVTDYDAFLNGIEIRWVDDAGEVVEEKVSPLTYIKMQKEFARRWTGQKLDDETLESMRLFIKQYDYTDSDGVSYGHTFQNYNWVYQLVYRMGLNPTNDAVNEQFIKDHMEVSWLELFENEQLMEQEIEYWNNHDRVQFPLTISYMPAYNEIVHKTQWINVIFVLFVMVVLCDVCSADRSKRVRQLIQTTDKGMGKAIIAKLCAGVSITIITGFVLYLITMLIQFSLLGADGFNAPVQLIKGLIWSRLSLTCGEAMLILCGTSILIAIVVVAITMLLSELFQNSIAAISVPSMLLLFSLLFSKSIFHPNREIAQLWQYFPLQRVGVDMLNDERLILIGKQLVAAIPFGTIIYLCIAIVSLTVCAGIAYIRRVDWR